MPSLRGLLRTPLRCLIAALACVTTQASPTQAQRPPAGAPEPVVFVFDLDDTLIRYLRPPETEAGLVLPREGDLFGYRYRVLDGVAEMLHSLLREVPGARIAFYSGGPRARNERILSELMLPDGRSAMEAAFLVLSKEETIQEVGDGHPAQNTGENARFRGHEKKDLRQFARDGVKLENVILIDDNLAWAHRGQEKNFLWLGSRPKFHQVRLGEGPQSAEEFVRDRNKLARARGLIDRALEKSRSDGIPISEALWRLQWLPNPAGGEPLYNEPLWTDAALYRRGAQAFHRANPKYRFTPAAPDGTQLGCVRDRIEALLAEALSRVPASP